MTVLFWADKHQWVNKRAGRGVHNGARIELTLCTALLALVTAQEWRMGSCLFTFVFCLRDSQRSKIKWEPTQIHATFPLKLNFSFYQEAILALMLDRQLKGQQVPLVAFCQGFLTCLWIKISQEEGRPEFPVILKTAMNLKMLQKPWGTWSTPSNALLMPRASHVNMHTELFWICSVNFLLWNKLLYSFPPWILNESDGFPLLHYA